MPKKKIIFAVTKSFLGGAQRYVYDLATHLPKDIFEILVIAGDSPDSKQNHNGNNLLQKLKDAGVRTITIPGLGRDISLVSDIRAFFFLVKIFWQEKPDIIHLNSSKMGGLGGLAAKITGARKIIFTAHGWGFNDSRFWLVKKLIKLIIWFYLLLCDRVITVSKAVFDDAAHLPFLRKKLVLIHNGVEKQDFLKKEAARNFFRSKYSFFSKIAPETVWIGTISELTKNKGLEYIIGAAAAIKDLPFVFLIIGSGELKDELWQLIKKEGLENKILLAGYLDDAAKYLLALDIFTITSITEALTYAILEAGLAGLPVIASQVGGIPEIITSAKNGVLVIPKDIKSICLAIKNLTLDTRHRKQFGDNLKQTVEKNFPF